MKPMSPCKDCEKREVGCHSKCAKYMKFFHDSELFRNKIHEEAYINNGIYEIMNKHKKNKYGRR